MNQQSADDSDWSVDKHLHTRHYFNRESLHKENLIQSHNHSPNMKLESNNEYVYVHYPSHNNSISDNKSTNDNGNNYKDNGNYESNNYGAFSVFNLANDTDYNTPYKYNDNMNFKKNFHNSMFFDGFSFPKFIYHLLLLTHDKIINVNNCTVIAQDPKYNRG